MPKISFIFQALIEGWPVSFRESISKQCCYWNKTPRQYDIIPSETSMSRWHLVKQTPSISKQLFPLNHFPSSMVPGTLNNQVKVWIHPIYSQPWNKWLFANRYIYLEPQWPLFFKVKPSKTRAFPIKTRVICVLGNNIDMSVYFTFPSETNRPSSTSSTTGEQVDCTLLMSRNPRKEKTSSKNTVTQKRNRPSKLYIYIYIYVYLYTYPPGYIYINT